MTHLPAKRLAVYIAVGLVVLAVGGIGVLSLRGGGSAAQVVTVDSGTGSGANQAAASEGSSGTVTTTTLVPSTTTTVAAIIFVQVAGAVRRPGVYQVAADARVFQVLQQAGGITADADQEALPLAAQVFDGCRIEVPRKGQPHGAVLLTGPAGASGSDLGGTASADSATGSAGSTSNGAQAPGAKVPLNSATVEQLDTLPGIGPKTAQEIVSYRQQHGPFTSVDQLTEVKGIGPAKLERLRSLVTL